MFIFNKIVFPGGGNMAEKENVIEVLKSINSINSQKVKIVTVGTSGTIKALKKKHLTNFY